MGLLRSNSPTSTKVTTGVDVDLGQVDDALKAAKKKVAQQAKAGMRRAGEVAILPRARAAAAATMPAVSVAAVTVRARQSEAYLTTQGPKLGDRITGLLEFGGTVSTQIVAKGAGLPVGPGIIRHSVNAPREYQGKGVLRAAVADAVPTFESILLEEITDAFDPIPHTP